MFNRSGIKITKIKDHLPKTSLPKINGKSKKNIKQTYITYIFDLNNY